MDCLLQLSGQVYTKFDALLDGKAFTKCVRSDLEMMQMQESKHCFNPVLANAVSRLEQGHKLRRKYSELLKDKVMYPQVTAIDPLPNEFPRLEYLQLGKQKPKPIASLQAEIEDDFMPMLTKKKKPLDERQLKRKIKAEEKKAIRELKKDTLVIQHEKDRVKQMRKDKLRKSTFRGGNAPKDETA